MSARRLGILVRRDLVDAIRDGRILIGVILPIVLVLFYDLTMDDTGGPAGIGVATLLSIFGIVMLAGFIAMLVVPILLVEEVELGTLDALQLVARTHEIIIAKLVVGLTYCALAIGVTIAVSDLDVQSWLGFIGAALYLSVAMAGFGLVFGLALGDPGRINTWSGVVIVPLLAPPFLVLGDIVDEPWRTLLELLPTGAGTELLAEAAMPGISDAVTGSLIALAAWTIFGFALLWRMLERRSS